jgi:hypothetical protein
MRIGLLLLGTCAFAAVLASRDVIGRSEPETADARRALSGAWTLNPVLSDTVPEDDLAQDSLVLTIGPGTATFYQRDGSRQVYRLSGRRERRDLGSGPVWTMATWDGQALRLQVEDGRGIRIVQTFSLDRHTRRLLVVTSPDARRLPMNTVRLIYDPLIDRAP